MGVTVDLLVRAPRAVVAGVERGVQISVQGGQIVAVGELNPQAPDHDCATTVLDLTNEQVLLPGLVDTHVHLQDPGRRGWEGFDSGTRAAAAGGITTLVDMPVDSVPSTVDVESLDTKRASAAGRIHVDLGFWAGICVANLAAVPALQKAGVLGFKAFLIDQGLPGLPPVALHELERVLTEVAARGSVLLVHAELEAPLSAVGNEAGNATRTNVTSRYAELLATRPSTTESDAVSAVLLAARRTSARVHIVHVSTAESVRLLARSRSQGVAASGETCPHYLALNADDIADNATSCRAAPLIRGSDDQLSLWHGLRDGSLSMVVSDHSPPDPTSYLSGDIASAPAGIIGLQHSLSATWTAARDRGFSLIDVVRWMAEAPAKLAGLSQKGVLEVGRDADMCVFAPDKSLVVDATKAYHQQARSPWVSRPLRGVVEQTWLRGQLVDGANPRGEFIATGNGGAR